MIDNDKAHRRRVNKFAKDDKQEIDNAVQTLLENYSGRKFLWHLLTISKIGQNPHTGEALSTAFACGELNIGQQILAHIIEVSPSGYIQMQREQQEEYVRRFGKSADPADGDPADE